MSVTTLLPVGYAFSMEQNVIYAVPARTLEVMVDDVIEISPVFGTTFASFGTIAANTPTTIAGGCFARCTGSTATVVLTAF